MRLRAGQRTPPRHPTSGGPARRAAVGGGGPRLEQPRLSRAHLELGRASGDPIEAERGSGGLSGLEVDSSCRRNTLTEGVAMRAGRRRSDRALRAVLPGSPGRPGVAQRENRRRFWAAIAAGRSSEAAAIEAGVSPAVGGRWFREAGGMPPTTLAPSAKPPSERYLVFAEREEIALCRAQGQGIREIARRLGR